MSGFRLLRALPTVALWAAVLATLAGAPSAQADGVPLPALTKPAGTSCVEDPTFMRRNHMELLKHQRDETMRGGIRTAKHALKECVACHAVPDAGGKPVTADSKDHFCSACHSYAAVQIDCFSCHNSVPDQARQAAR